jgi:integrase
MPARRSRGDGGLYWDRSRQRWIASVTVGYTPSGKRIVKRASGTSKTAAQRKLKEIIREYQDGLTVAPDGYTVAEAVRDWLAHGLNRRSQKTINTCTILSNTHIIPALGARKLKDLRADDIDKWLAGKSRTLSTASLYRLHSCLNRAIKRAMARDKVRRNVVELCTVPTGQSGRPSKALTLAQAEAVLQAARHSRMHAYIVVSLLTGARTEELRALTWDHVDLDGDPHVEPAVPPHVEVWRSVRVGGDTKTRKSRRTLALPKRCVDALRALRDRQGRERAVAGSRWNDNGLVFTTRYGTALSPANVRRDFRKAIDSATVVDAREWTPRELRHSFVSLLSDNDMPLEKISRLVGHQSTVVTELIYRKQIRPVMETGAEAMDRIFGADKGADAGS